MGVFDDLIQINNNGDIVYNSWIEWQHFLIPNKPDWLRQIVRAFMAIFGHCLNCTILDGCYFVERIMPELPLHEKCDCNKQKKIFQYCKIPCKS